jgi:hypothetical protein
MSHPLDLLIRTLATASGRSTPARARTKSPDIEGSAAAIDGLIGTLERHLPGRGRADVLDATPANGGFAGPDRVAIGLARAETRLRTLADRIERMRAARWK